MRSFDKNQKQSIFDALIDAMLVVELRYQVEEMDNSDEAAAVLDMVERHEKRLDELFSHEGINFDHSIDKMRRHAIEHGQHMINKELKYRGLR